MSVTIADFYTPKHSSAELLSVLSLTSNDPLFPPLLYRAERKVNFQAAFGACSAIKP